MHHTARGGGATTKRRGRTPAAIDRTTDLLEARWGSLPEVPEGMGFRLDRIDLSRLSGRVLA